MSTSEPVRPKGTIHATAQSEMTEVRISDAGFKKVPLPQGNSGDVEVELPEGIYQVEFRDGTCWPKAEPILLLAGSTWKVEQGPAGSLPIVGLVGSATASAGMASIASVGRSGQVQTMVSDALDRPTAADASAAEAADAASAVDWESAFATVSEDHDPETCVVTVLVRSGRGGDGASPTATEIDAQSLSLVGPQQQRLQPSTDVQCLRFRVTPGAWRLQLDTGARELVLEMPLFVAKGWRLVVSCPRRSYATREERRVDLANAVVRMERAAQIDQVPHEDRERMRKLELNALKSLSQGRVLHGKSFNGMIRELLAQKFFNPLLGLYAAYLLPCRDSDEIGLLAEAIEHLADLTERGPERNQSQRGEPHPDVQALRLKLAMLRGDGFEQVQALSFPPMLRAGWESVQQASLKFPDVVLDGSLFDRIAGDLWGPSPWVIWKRPPAISQDAAPERALAPSSISLERAQSSCAEVESLEELAVLVDVALSHEALRTWFRTAQLSSEERSVAQAIHAVAEDERGQLLTQRLRMTAPPNQAESHVPAVERLSRQTRLPAKAIYRAVKSLASQLLDQAGSHQLDLKARSLMARPEVVIPYDSEFLGDGFSVSLPQLTPSLLADTYAEGAVLDYTHYSLVMHARRRVAAYCAHNVDGSRIVRVAGGLPWKMDERVGEYQLGPEVYADNQLDRGHLVRRADVLWGTVAEARAANKATFFYSNAAPQHQNFNQDEWVALEDWILYDATDFSYRLCVFTGPVLRDDDPVLSDLPPDLRMAFRARGQAQIPAAFWKIITLRDARAGGDDLSAVAFAMKQSEMWNDKEGRRLLNLKVHQVTIQAIEGWTGLDFGTLRDVDELQWSERILRAAELSQEPEWPVVRSAGDITYSGVSRRARGIRAARGASPAARTIQSRGVGTQPHSPCGCDGGGFDAEKAVAALSRDLAQVVEILSGQKAPAAGGPRGVGAEDAASSEPALSQEAESRLQDLVSQAPEALKDRVRKFGRTIIIQSEIQSGRLPAPAATAAKRIVGGDLVPPGGFPSCCCIGDASRWFCTGVVVAPQVVLTAAHCGSGITRVMVGGNQVSPMLDAGARIVPVRRVIIHPQYRGAPFSENDINVLILNSPAGVVPAPLATIEEMRAASDVELVGFGFNDPERPLGFGIKRQVAAPLGLVKLSPSDDLGQLPSTLGFHEDYEFVAGRKGLGRDSCNGDSGGPAYVRNQNVLMGLTSRATREAQVNCGDGGIYVRPDMFKAWIAEVATSAGVSVFF